MDRGHALYGNGNLTDFVCRMLSFTLRLGGIFQTRSVSGLTWAQTWCGSQRHVMPEVMTCEVGSCVAPIVKVDPCRGFYLIASRVAHPTQ